ncbi:hypothetical protein [Burkholderia gladioli]|uniref:hypothetical protein n=1 Tax=Burkholderia gladioli TaxID=28095 RepID=UPI00163F70A5|nr:hypothetical protein [Burkholderia gladioli]
MKDNELRGVVLEKLYEYRHRESRFHSWTNADLAALGVEENVLFTICDQLGEHGLIDWKPVRSMSGTHGGMARITAHGVDVVEQTDRASLSISFVDNSQHVNVHSSSNVQIGDNNTQSIVSGLEQLVRAINDSSAAPEEKQSAQSKLKSFINSPVVSSILGGAVGSLVAMLK